MPETSEQPSGISLKASLSGRINAAFHQNSVPAIAEIVLVNDSGNDLSDVTISVSAVPGFLRPQFFRLDRIRAGGTARISPVAVDLDAAFLLGLTEAVLGEISIVATSGEAELARLNAGCQVLSSSEWTGLAAAPELIAAFVRPNDPAIDAILRNAAEKLRQAGREPSVDGYRSHRKARAWELAEAIWAALCDELIVYALPPQSFERDGQKVRSPSAVLEKRIGTCLDLTLLFAACLEAAGLNALIGFSEGHAYVGLWLIEEDFPLGIVDEPQTLRKRLGLDELVLIETTLLASQPPVRFRAAVERAARLVSEDAERRFELAVDLRRARSRQIKPLAFGTETGTGVTVSPAPPVVATLDEPPIFTEEHVVAEGVDESLDRLERWKRKLLDLSLRNRLLNFKITKGAVPIVCPDPAALEDLLAEGKRIRLLADAEIMRGRDPRDAELHSRVDGGDAAIRYAADALQRGDVHADLPAEELEARLTEIYRTARSSFEEGGSNSLFLAIGFISWLSQGRAQSCKAPLLLVPVALERRTIRSGFRLARHDDDPRINPTLLQLLRQDFDLSIPEFERELPSDAAGLDVKQIWRIARTHLKDVKGFELIEEVVLSNFSFAKYLMWKDLVDRTDLLKRNPVVKHLIDTPKESYGDGSGLPDECRLDDEIHPRELFLPLPADSSQTAAVVAASRRQDFVLFGPPGTGKSQTIANMIVQLLAHGRTVLFVSAKTTALEVVWRRLDDVGLGSFCLQVHSAKAQKSAVLSQLKSAWEARASGASGEWDGKTAELKVLRDRLNGLVAALHHRHRNGLTAHQALGRVVAGRDFLPGFALSFKSPDQHDEAEMRHYGDVCRAIRTAIDAVGRQLGHPLARIGRRHWSPVWQSELLAAAARFRASTEALATCSADVAALFGASTTGDPRRSREFLALLAQALTEETENATPLLTSEGGRLREAFDAWRPIQARYREVASGLSCTYRDGVFALDLVRLLEEWRQAAGANIFVRGARKKRVYEMLAPFTDNPPPQNTGAEIARLIDLKALREAAQQHDAALVGLGRAWQGLSTDLAQIEALFAWAEATRLVARRLAQTDQTEGFWIDALISLVGRFGGDPTVRNDCQGVISRLVDAYQAFETDRKRLVQLAEPADDWWEVPLGDDWLPQAGAAVRSWIDHAPQLQRWCAWRQVVSDAEERGLGPLVAALAAGSIAPEQIRYAFDLGYARWWIVQVVEREELLRSFVAQFHEDAIARFAELDAALAELAKQVVAGQLCRNVPPPTAFGRDLEFGILAREIQKKAKHLPLRQLFRQMPTALTKLAPCMMMSPLSVAQFLPPDTKPFDAVMFDEASQIPVWDAIGAIARGTQVIVVGDPKQLPPTSFFDRTSDDYDAASDLEDDLESILDECLGANIPHKRLAWHYRSRHESLIAFSNERYYDGRLVTFPSPVTDDRAVRYVHVPDGVYERGSGRVNRQEARAVVQEVVNRLLATEATVTSLGIVTFNMEQRRLIETMLDQERRARPELESFFTGDRHEPVFVKNLESVQGDERDVIFFSVGYGPDASGRVSQNFGPLNSDGGPRRLNVAITRARSELVIFATLKPDQIDLSRAKAAGVRDFKHFLEYAERGPRTLAEAAAPLGLDAESPLEEAVQQALERRGWAVHPQVGVAGFRVDFGIVHPDAPGRYLAGIECDGATYHRSATARDRDLLRERVLCGLGWRIHRVWSTDWWVDADRALETLVAALDADLTADRQQTAETQAATAALPGSEFLASPPDPNEEGSGSVNHCAEPDDARHERGTEPDLTRIYAEQVTNKPAMEFLDAPENFNGRQYRFADFTGFPPPTRDAFYELTYRPTLRRMVAHVITIEGPIFDDVLVHRIAHAHGFGRAAARIREVVLDAVEHRFTRSREEDRSIFWPEGAQTENLSSFRSSTLGERDHNDIPLVELAALARRFLENGATTDEAAALMAQELGLSRLRDAARSRFIRAAHLAEGP